MTTHDDLQPLKPERAVQMYESHRRGEVTAQTLDGQVRELQRFVEWCDENDIKNCNELNGRALHEYRLWRKQRNGGIAQTTLQNVLSIFNRFLKFCQTVDAVQQGLHEKLIIPDRGRASRDELLEAEHAQRVLNHLSKFEYGSRDHASFATMWFTGMRVGAVHSLDVDDVHLDDETPHLEVRHRPEQGTRLKNDQWGERLVYVRDELAEALRAYIDHNRLSTTDDHGRDPLFTTQYGRASKDVHSRIAYKWTAPCQVGMECPHGEDPETCESARNSQKASKCPSTVGPHPFRRGSITHLLTEGMPQEVVSERTDVSSEVIDKHYDKRTEKEKLQARQQFLDDMPP